MIPEIKFYLDRVITHGHVSKDPAFRYITIHEMGIIADKLCSADEDASTVKIKVKEYLLRKAYSFNQLASKIQ